MTRRDRGEWRQAFLAALRCTGNVKQSCELAKVARKQAYLHRAEDEDFASEWQDALDEAIDGLEQEARKRALKSSDLLLIFLLKAHRPEMYREVTRHELTGRDGAPLIPIATLREALRRGTKGA